VEIERLCRGEGFCAWPTSDRAPTPPERAALELDASIDGLEPLLFLVKSLLDRLMKALVLGRHALAELQVVAQLDDRSTVVHAITPPRPTLDASSMMTLLRLWLERRPFGAPVVALELVAAKSGVATARQLGLFDAHAEHEADALERAAARLASAFGSAAVVRPVLGNSYRPEHRLCWVPFAAPGKPTGSARPAGPVATPSPSSSSSCLVLRSLVPPQPILWKEGTPWLCLPGQPPVRVVAVEGPQRLAGEWWVSPFDRSYFWLSLEGGPLWWVYRDEVDGRAYLHAVAD
jgi:protein ImuB